jgi:lipopolysaccharide export system permease protein
MLKRFIINKYISKEFLKIIFNMSISFFCIGFIINFFEELNFFKDYQVGMEIPIILTALYIPSLLYNMLPFIFFLSGMWFFYSIKKNDEIIAMKISGMSNLSIISIPGLLSIILGIIFITCLNPVTSVLVKKYESVKGAYYEKEQDYLASVTDNGIWIKEINSKGYNIIRANKIENEFLIDVSIYLFNQENNFIKRIESKSANIFSNKWILKESNVVNQNGEILEKNIDMLEFQSTYNIKKIRSLYSNLDTISFWRLNDEINNLERRGYSSSKMKAKLQKSLSFPFFILSMVLLSGVFTLGSQAKESNWKYIFVSILGCVLVFYFNDFSAALGKTEKLPIEVSVWMPITIIFIFSSIGLIHANYK